MKACGTESAVRREAFAIKGGDLKPNPSRVICNKISSSAARGFSAKRC